MTIIPAPVYKPFRRFEIVSGLIFIGLGTWALLQLIRWSVGAPTHLELDSLWGASLLLAAGLFLLAFGGGLISSGYISLFFWLLAIYVVITMQVSARVFA